MSGMGLTGESVAVIHVSDINNHAPQFNPVQVGQYNYNYCIYNITHLSTWVHSSQYNMLAVENRHNYEVGRVNVTDKDDHGTGNWEVKYSIYNDPHRNFAISTDPSTNQGILIAVKVRHRCYCT